LLLISVKCRCHFVSPFQQREKKAKKKEKSKKSQKKAKKRQKKQKKRTRKAKKKATWLFFLHKSARFEQEKSQKKEMRFSQICL